MNVYLHELDVNEHGTEISLPCVIDEYLIKYCLFVDEVYLQSSSSLKRQDVFLFFQNHFDLCCTDDTGFGSLVTFVLDSCYESLSHYIDDRLTKLSKQIHGEINTELTIYRANKAVDRAKKLDLVIQSDDIKRRNHNIDSIFKSNLLNCHIPIIGDDFSLGKNIITNYVLQSEFVQTFQLMDLIKKSVLYDLSADEIGKYIRKCYYSANAEAVDCTFHDRDWHLCYENISRFSELIGLDRIFRYKWDLKRDVVIAIKKLHSFNLNYSCTSGTASANGCA